MSHVVSLESPVAAMALPAVGEDIVQRPSLEVVYSHTLHHAPVRMWMLNVEISRRSDPNLAPVVEVGLVEAGHYSQLSKMSMSSLQWKSLYNSRISHVVCPVWKL